MKKKTVILFLLVALAAGAIGWWAARHHSPAHGDNTTRLNGERKIRFYQCSMHPQVKSDQPGKCTICGMALSPIYEGQSELTENLIALSPSTIQVVNIQTAPVQKGSLQRTIRVAGTIDDDDTKHRIISAYIEGRIDELFVNFTGAEVTRGEPLASLYSPAMLTAEREYRLLAQKRPTNGNRELVTDHERLLEAAGQRLERLGLTTQQIVQLSKTTNSVSRSTIVAPMSGTVVSRMAYEGQYVKEGDRLFEIADFSTMWFKFDAYEQDLPWLKPGQKVDVTTPSVPGRTFQGEITFIDPNVNDPTRSAKVRVNLANPMVEENGKRRLLLHRLFAEGTVRVEAPETLVIPRTAVLNPGGNPVVYVEQGESSYQVRKVKLGLRGDDTWQVIDGLKEGEKVVTYGNTLIDAQAQLNQSSQATGGQPVEAQDAVAKVIDQLEELNETQRSSAQTLLDSISRLAANLAADDIKAFNKTAETMAPAFSGFTNAWAPAKSWVSLVQPIQASGNLKPAKDLAAARKAFHPFSMAVAEFTKHLRSRDKTFATMKVYRCPMVNQAIPGAPKNGFWVQLQEPLQNPFFGSDMLECGTEVEP